MFINPFNNYIENVDDSKQCDIRLPDDDNKKSQENSQYYRYEVFKQTKN